MKEFVDLLKEEASNIPDSMTENGAMGYSSTGKKLLDMNFKISSYRSLPESEIVEDFEEVFNDNSLLAMKFLFFIGDIRKGLGERRIFKACLKWLADIHPEYISACIDLIPEYSRWDYIMTFFGTRLEDKALELISSQLKIDMNRLAWDKNKPISLLAKWLPSCNTSSKTTRMLSMKIRNYLQMSEKKYRKTLSMLRERLKVVEKQMSANEWGEIDYESVPSKANLIYAGAFLRKDKERREKFLESLKSGRVKINSSVTFPHEIVHKVSTTYVHDMDERMKNTYDELWKALPNYIGDDDHNIMVVVDGSGSMESTIMGTSVSSLDVAEGIGLYFSERLKGPFKDKYITFSSNPRFVDFSSKNGIVDKVNYARTFDECSNTDIYKVFKLILNTAVKNKLSQLDLPDKILIISDMEFDSCANFNSSLSSLFQNICEEYKNNGYKVPGLVFWNVCSRTNTIPLKQHSNGLALVSGFSPTIASMILSGEMDPFKIILEKLNSERYLEIEERLISNKIILKKGQI